MAYAIRFKLLIFIIIVFLCSPVRGDDDCLVGSNSSDGPMSIEFLAHFGNITLHLQGKETPVGISFCLPSEFTVGGEACGSGYLMMYEDGCSGLFSSLEERPQRQNNSIIFTLKSNSALSAIRIDCETGSPGLKVLNATETNGTYQIHLASETICPGYAPERDEGMLPKGAIIAIVSGIVAVVVIASVVFQWKSRSRSGDDYSQLV